MHPGDWELDALARGEPLGERADAVRRHAQGCAHCAACIQALRTDGTADAWYVRVVDHQIPPVTVDGLLARARMSRGAPRTVARGTADSQARAWARRRTVRVAASVALMLTAATAAAAPGSPLHTLLARALAPVLSPLDSLKQTWKQTSTRLPPARRPVVAAPQVHESTAVLLLVPEPELEVVFRDVQDAGTLYVADADAPTVRLTQTGGSAAFALTPRGISVDNVGSHANFSLEVPPSLARLRVRVGSRLVFYRKGRALLTPALLDARGAYVIPLTSPSSAQLPTLPRRLDP